MFTLAYLYIHVYYLSGICNERCVLGNKQDFTSFIDINCVRNYNVICCQMFIYIIYLSNYIEEKHECIYC